jgi:glycosyltransferase involved in cell wall biosynthesis
MKLLYIIPGLYRVGDFERSKRFAEALAARGNDVTLLMGNRAGHLWYTTFRLNGVNIVEVPYWGELRLAEFLFEAQPDTKLPLDILFRTVWLLLNVRSFDVVHFFHIGMSSFIPSLVSNWVSRDTVFIQDWCDLWCGGILRPRRTLLGRLDHLISCVIERWSIRAANAVTVNSGYLAARSRSEFRIPDRRVLKVREGADLDLIRPSLKSSCRTSVGLSQNVTWIGFSAFFNPDSQLLVDALVRLREVLRQPFRVLWIGQANEALLRSFSVAGLNDVITSVGSIARDQIGTYLGACDILILPFSARPVNLARWPAKFGDYLAAGRPVVSNPTGEIEHFFRRHPNIGALAEANPDSISEAISALLRAPDTLDQAGQASRLAAEADLSWAVAAEHMELFYHYLNSQLSREH